MSFEKILRKHVAIIHAYSMMSVLQRKIANILFAEALKNKNIEENHNSVSVECYMSFSKLAKTINFNSNNTQYLKEAIDGLASLKIEWNLLKDKMPINVSFLNLRILHGPPTFYHDGIFNFSFHKLMFNFIGNPPIYGTIDMSIQSQFESKYGHSLYENSTRFLNLQTGKIIALDTLRKLLGVNEEKYLTMRELTRNVIQPSIEEVNDRSEFVVNMENIKTGRKIIGFNLSVSNKKKLISTNEEIINHKKNKIHEEIKKYFGKLSESVFNHILKNYSEEYILEKIIYTREHAKKDKLGLYPIPYFIKAIKDDYQSNELHLLNNEEKTETVVSKCSWNEQLNLLKLDLLYWQRQLESVKTMNNDLLAENTKKIISNCKQKIQQHFLKMPTTQLMSETP